MKILIAGATGFIGRHLVDDFTKRGWTVVAITRHPENDGIYWNPNTGELQKEKLEGADVIINLAGETVAERWTANHKKAIYDSRIKGTNLLVSAITGLQAKPKLYISASAIGYYGERGAEILTEDSSNGKNYLAKVCADWEAATKPLESAGIRTVFLRFGIVLSTTGGAFPRMLMPFKVGGGGRLGTGKQYMSWITVDDAVEAVHFAIENDQISGPINVVSPQPVTNSDFTDMLGRLMHRPTLMPVPVAMVHMAFGNEMADEVLLASSRCLPERLSSAGFQFKFPQLEPALTHVLKDHV